MAITDVTFFKPQDQILAEMLAQLVGAIPDAYTGEDGVLVIVFNIEAGQLETVYLANQLLLEDMFITTASAQALQRHGEEYGVFLKDGTYSAGTLMFTGDGGTYIPVGTEVGYDPGNGLPVIFFNTVTDGTIPNPGNPTAPTVAVNATAGNLNGTYEYMVTFVTAAGETLPSPDSNAVSPVNQQVNLTNIPLGGVGTTSRRIYRMKNGVGPFRLVATIANNTTTAYTDNITDAAVAGGAQIPTVDTAHGIVVNGQSQDTGTDGNAGIGTITVLTNAPSALISVTNPTAFTGGSEPDDTENYRQRLLAWVQNPQTGSPNDLKAWAEAVPGVETATVFPNTPAPGSATVRISGPGGTIPSSTVISAVTAALSEQDLANATILVLSFSVVATDITVDVTTSGTYLLADVTPSVQAVIAGYINGLPVGGTLYRAGLIDAVFGLPGIADVTVTTPSANLTTAADSKRVPGIITVV